MNDTFASISSVVGFIGGGLGAVSAMVVLGDRRQHITVDRLPPYGLIRFRITNRTLRPIPLGSLILRFREHAYFGKWAEAVSRPQLKGITLPGILNPEESKEIEFSIRDTVAVLVYKAFQLEVETQTGKKIRKTFRYRHVKIKDSPTLS